MYHKIYLLLLSICFVVFVNGQNISAQLRYGIPTKRFQPAPIGSEKNGVFSVQAVSDISLVLQTRFSLSQKYQVNYLVGLDIGNSRGYWPISAAGIDFKNLENLVYNKQRVSVRWLGLEKRFNLIDEKLWISANVVLLSRFYLGSEKQYESDYKTNNEDYIAYRYDFRLYHNKRYDTDQALSFSDLYLNLESGLQLEGAIKEGLTWNINLAYYRNVYNYYNFDLDLIYSGTNYYNNMWNQTLDSEKLIQREHYFALGLGMTYKF